MAEIAQNVSPAVLEARESIIKQLEQMERDNLQLPVHESWPAGLAEAVLEYYGKFAAGRTVDGKIAEIHVNPMSKKRSDACNKLFAEMGINPDNIPTIRLN